MHRVVICPYDVFDSFEGAGHFWVYMQYVLGLRALGCEVFWLERVKPDPRPGSMQERLAAFHRRLERFGLAGRVILYAGGDNADPDPAPPEFLAPGRAEAEEAIRSADLLINFHYEIAPAILRRFRRTALIDIDPGLLQFWMRAGQIAVPAHDVGFTTGERIPSPASDVLGRPRRWIPIRPPVSLQDWPDAADPAKEDFTTISNWDASDWVVEGSESYDNTKRTAFLRYANLPRMTSQPLELALFLRTEADAIDRRMLESRGWRVRLSSEVSSTPEGYRAYIQGSRGEFSCAKRSYILLKNAWVSDRTICYLASGKPVVVEDTGPSEYLPRDEGMFRVSSPVEAAVALDAINADYARHCRAARRLASEQFDARHILKTILEYSLA